MRKQRWSAAGPAASLERRNRGSEDRDQVKEDNFGERFTGWNSSRNRQPEEWDRSRVISREARRKESNFHEQHLQAGDRYHRICASCTRGGTTQGGSSTSGSRGLAAAAGCR